MRNLNIAFWGANIDATESDGASAGAHSKQHAASARKGTARVGQFVGYNPPRRFPRTDFDF